MTTSTFACDIVTQYRELAGVYSLEGEAGGDSGSAARVEWTPARSRVGAEWAMPAAETELLRAFREAFETGNRGWNSGDVKTAYAGLPDELEYRLAPTWPEGGRVLRSRDEVIEFFEDFQETFPDARTTSHEYLDGAHGTVVVGFRVAGTGRTSGVEGQMDIWQVWEIRDPDNLAVTRVSEFTNRRDAAEAAGLSEQ